MASETHVRQPYCALGGRMSSPASRLHPGEDARRERLRGSSTGRTRTSTSSPAGTAAGEPGATLLALVAPSFERRTPTKVISFGVWAGQMGSRAESRAESLGDTAPEASTIRELSSIAAETQMHPMMFSCFTHAFGELEEPSFQAFLPVPGVGVEPTRAEAQRTLSPPRLPFRHPGSGRGYCDAGCNRSSGNFSGASPCGPRYSSLNSSSAASSKALHVIRCVHAVTAI